MRNYRSHQLILILTPFVFSFAFGLDIYLPILTEMVQTFDTSIEMIHLTMSLFLFTAGMGQLILGPLADQWGRKPVFYASSICFALGGLLCAASHDVGWLIVARIVCALGACGMLVTAFAVVRDLYSGSESAKTYSYLNGAIGISPTFAPVIGGYLAYYMGWESIFIFLGLIGILGLLMTKFCIQETQPVEKRVKFDRKILHRYASIFTNRQFLIYSILAGMGESVFFCFFSTSPLIIIELHGIPSHEFGYYFAVFGMVIGLGGFFSGKTVERMGPEATIRLGISLLFLGGASMIAWNYLGHFTLKAFLLPMVIACLGAMFICGAAAARALEPFGKIAGTAAAAFGATDFTISSISGAILMLFPVDSTIPYGISIILMGICSLLLFRLRNSTYATAC